MNDFYAEWKHKQKWHEAEANKWKNDLVKGQIVIATQDIEYSDYSSRYVPAGTKGRVIRHGEYRFEWGIRWDGKRDTWYCGYKPSDIRWYMDQAEDAFAFVEFVPLDVWDKFHENGAEAR